MLLPDDRSKSAKARSPEQQIVNKYQDLLPMLCEQHAGELTNKTLEKALRTANSFDARAAIGAADLKPGTHELSHTHRTMIEAALGGLAQNAPGTFTFDDAALNTNQLPTDAIGLGNAIVGMGQHDGLEIVTEEVLHGIQQGGNQRVKNGAP